MFSENEIIIQEVATLRGSESGGASDIPKAKALGRSSMIWWALCDASVSARGPQRLSR